MKRQAATPTTPTWDPLAMALVSIILFIHSFCIFVALSGNLMRSELQDQLLRGLFRPYLQALNFDPDATPYHLTRGSVDDVDHRWEILPAGEDARAADAWVVLPPGGLRWSESLKRWQRSAKLVAMQASMENEEAAAELARGVADYAVHQLDIRPAQIRCRRVHEIQIFNATGAEAPREFPYVANVLIDSTGRVSVARISERRETALPDSTPGTSAP